MGYLCESCDTELQTGHLPHALLKVKTADIGTELPSRDTTNGINKRRRELSILGTDSTELSISALQPISSDDSDDSSSDEENVHENGFHSYFQDNSRRPQQNKKRRRNRQVTFGDVASSTTYHPSELSKQDLKQMKPYLWFTKHDRLRSQAECQKVLKEFRIHNVEEVTQFSNVYRTSMQVPFSQAASDFLEQATISVPSVIRGMEWGLTPKLKKRRKQHIHSILTAQKEIRDIKLRERFVSSRSLRSSRPARIMARIIGEGDVVATATTSTALNIKTVPLETMECKETPLKTVTSMTAIPTASKMDVRVNGAKMGHAKRRRRPLLWRSARTKAIAIES